MKAALPLERVLVATDLSEASDQAVLRAHRIAERAGAELFVCHVLPDVLRESPMFPEQYQQALAQLPAFQERAADAVTQRVVALTGRKDSEFTVVIQDGPTHSAIVAAAEASKVDLVVVATRGRTGIARVVLGSVAELVTRYAHCSVLVSRDSPASGRVLAGTDFSDPSLPAIGAAAEWVRRFGGSLAVAHAVELTPASFQPVFPYGSVLPLPPPEEVAKVQKATTAQLVAALEKVGATGDTMVLDGFPPSVLVHAAEREQAELIVVGTAGRTGLKRVALGSVAELVVRRAPCSVLVVRLANA